MSAMAPDEITEGLNLHTIRLVESKSQYKRIIEQIS